jgi:hypothetical protein
VGVKVVGFGAEPSRGSACPGRRDMIADRPPGPASPREPSAKRRRAQSPLDPRKIRIPCEAQAPVTGPGEGARVERSAQGLTRTWSRPRRRQGNPRPSGSVPVCGRPPSNRRAGPPGYPRRNRVLCGGPKWRACSRGSIETAPGGTRERVPARGPRRPRPAIREPDRAINGAETQSETLPAGRPPPALDIDGASSQSVPNFSLEPHGARPTGGHPTPPQENRPHRTGGHHVHRT